MKLLLVAALLFQSAKHEAEKLEADLGKIPERTYRITESGKPAGTLVMKTRIDTHDEEKAVVFEDRLTGPGGAVMTHTEYASLDRLHLIWSERTGTGAGGRGNWTASIRDKDALIKNNDTGMLILRDASGALGERSVLRLLCLQEQKVGAVLEVNLVLLASPSTDYRHEIRCVARESVEVAGRKVDAFKWEHAWEGECIKAKGVVKASIDNAYWIDARGTLVRFRIGKTDFALQDAPAASEEEKVEAALKKFGDRKYKIVIGGVDAGFYSLNTRVEQRGDRKVAVFEDTSEVKIHDESESWRLVETASLDGLRVLTMSMASGPAPEFIISVDGDKATVQQGSGKKTIDITKSTIGQTAIYRLLAIQEQKVGATFKADLLNARQLDKDHAFRCVAKETIEIGGVKREACKWEQKGTSKVPVGGKLMTYDINNSYWVSPDGYMLKFTSSGNEMILETK